MPDGVYSSSPSGSLLEKMLKFTLPYALCSMNPGTSSKLLVSDARLDCQPVALQT